MSTTERGWHKCTVGRKTTIGVFNYASFYLKRDGGFSVSITVMDIYEITTWITLYEQGEHVLLPISTATLNVFSVKCFALASL